MKISLADLNNFIEKTNNGIDYKIKKLKIKKLVYSEAAFWKIPHKSEDKVDICLKIGRYKNNGSPENDTPKSELTLDNDEFLNLISFIQSYYKPLEMGVNSFIPIDNSNSMHLLQKFKSLMGSDEETAKLLLESGLLSDNITLTIDLIKKKVGYDEFNNSINCNLAESYWQTWFKNNKWILGSEYLYILTERNIDTQNITDYLVKAFDGFLDIVEIKKPNGLKFWMEAKDHDNYVPSSDLIKAITQCQNYIYEIEREANSLKFIQRTKGTKVIKPRCLLIYGRSNDWNEEQQEAYRILNASYNQITILTYDHLILRAKNILGINTDMTSQAEDDIPF